MKKRIKLLRVTTVPMSLRYLLRGQPRWMSEQGLEVHLASAVGKEIADVTDYENVVHHEVPMTRAITPFRDIRAIWKMYQLIKRESFDIVHSHTPKAGLVSMIAARLAGVSIRLHTVAGLPLMETTGFKRWLLSFIEKMIYRFATRVYSNSPKLRDFLITEFGVRDSKVKVLGNGSSNGIDSKFFDPSVIEKGELLQQKSALGLPDDAFVYLFVGRLVRDKGIHELVESFLLVNQKHQQTRLILVGPLEDDLDPLDASIIKEIQSNPNILFLGYQSDVRMFYKMSHILVFPSYREGFPNVPLQAGSMGIPVIATNINGCNEIVLDRENGILVEKKSAESLTNAMILLFEDEPLRNMLSGKTRELVVQRFDQHYLWTEILNDYRSLLNDV